MILIENNEEIRAVAMCQMFMHNVVISNII